MPLPAAALDFTFSFNGVTGLIQGLRNNALSLPTRVTVLSGGEPLAYPPSGATLGNYSYSEGPGFTVDSGGVLVAGEWSGSATSVGYLRFFIARDTIDPALPGLEIPAALWQPSNLPGDTPPYIAYGRDLVFTPVYESNPDTHVPGPLPLLGVGAAFGYSRKLKKRIKSTNLPVASAIH